MKYKFGLIFAIAASSATTFARTQPYYSTSCHIIDNYAASSVQNHGLGGFSVSGVASLQIFYPHASSPVRHQVVVGKWVAGQKTTQLHRFYTGPGASSCLIDIRNAIWPR